VITAIVLASAEIKVSKNPAVDVPGPGMGWGMTIKTGRRLQYYQRGRKPRIVFYKEMMVGPRQRRWRIHHTRPVAGAS